MKIERDRFFRLTLFSLLALFTLLLIGAERRNDRPRTEQELPGVISALSKELPAAERAAWSDAAQQRPVWLLQVASSR